METPTPPASIPPGPAEAAPIRPRRDPKTQWLLGIGAVIALIVAALVLREMNPTRVLTRSLKQGDDEARRVAAGDLSAVNVVNFDVAIPAIAEALVTDPSPEVRAEAARTTGTLAGEMIKRRDAALRDRAVGALMAAFDDKDPKVRDAAILTMPMLANSAVMVSENENDLRPIGAPRAIVAKLLPLLDGPDESARKPAATALGYFPVELDPSLPMLLKAAAAEPGGRGLMTMVLAKVRPLKPSVPLLVEALKAPDLRTRYLAAGALGRAGADAGDAVPDLLKLLEEPAVAGEPYDPGAAAATALGEIAPASPRALEVMTALQGAAINAPERRKRAITTAIRAFQPAP